MYIAQNQLNFRGLFLRRGGDCESFRAECLSGSGPVRAPYHCLPYHITQWEPENVWRWVAKTIFYRRISPPSQLFLQALSGSPTNEHTRCSSVRSWLLSGVVLRCQVRDLSASNTYFDSFRRGKCPLKRSLSVEKRRLKWICMLNTQMKWFCYHIWMSMELINISFIQRGDILCEWGSRVYMIVG